MILLVSLVNCKLKSAGERGSDQRAIRRWEDGSDSRVATAGLEGRAGERPMKGSLKTPRGHCGPRRSIIGCTMLYLGATFSMVLSSLGISVWKA